MARYCLYIHLNLEERGILLTALDKLRIEVIQEWNEYTDKDCRKLHKTINKLSKDIMKGA